MLTSIKLCADKLNGKATTTDSAGAGSSEISGAVLVISPVAELPAHAHVAIANANSSGTISDSNNLNSTISNTSTMVNNSNINNGVVRRQLHQYKGKYLDLPDGTKFHPYLRPATVVTHEHSRSSERTLFPAFPNSANSNTTANKAASITTDVTTVNATTLPSRQSALSPKQPATVSPANSSAASVFIDSLNNSDSDNNHTVVPLKCENMSEAGEVNDSLLNTNNTNLSAEAYIDSVEDNCSYLISLSNKNNKKSKTVDNTNGAPSEDSEFEKDQPDSDNIKMFVGQIPKSWDESQLRKMFEQYGRVHDLNILRDKVTSVSRGCCFITYYTRKAALRAQDALHNTKTLEGMHHPIQIKPADSENRNERKLFVGMLNKKYNEADVRQLFTGHGTIEECTVLRDQNGQSKGCAFVTFATKHNAIGAIKALHQNRTMEGCSAPLVVKFADTQKEKDQKKIQQLQASLVGITALTSPATGAIAGLASAPPNGLSPSAALVPSSITATNVRTNYSMPPSMAAMATPQPTAIANPASALVPTSPAITVPQSLLTATGSPQQMSPYQTTAEAMQVSAAQLHIFQQLQAFGLHPTQYLQGLNFPPDHSVTTASLSAGTAAANTAASSQPTNAVGNGLLSTRSISMQNLVTLATLGAHNYPPTQALQPHSHVVAQSQQRLQQHHHGITYTPQQTQSQITHLLQMPLAMTTQLAGAATPTLWSGGKSLTSPYAAALSPLTNDVAFATTVSPLSNTALQAATAGIAGKQIEGPDGSNLFIYHLPQEFTDTDLASTFLPFGNVLSAKVFIDKQTNMSKCFGFVSYDNPHSASAAIQAMHGFQIGSKRLKVQHKRSKDAAKPY